MYVHTHTSLVIDLPNSSQHNRLTVLSMGLCSDPSDCNLRIIGLSVVISEATLVYDPDYFRLGDVIYGTLSSIRQFSSR